MKDNLKSSHPTAPAASPQPPRKKICFVTAVPGTARSFLKDHFKKLGEDYDVYLASNIKEPKDVEGLELKGVRPIAIHRAISLGADLKAVKLLASYFKKMRFDAVHSVTPKAGLVTALAARLAGIPVRTHIFTGQVWATRRGAMRQMLKAMDRLIAFLDTDILVDGQSQLRYLEQQRILRPGRGRVLGAGSISGVNVRRFLPSEETRLAQRRKLGVTPGQTVFVFMGRLNPDKGVYELFEAFNRLGAERDDAYLLMLGRDEADCMSRLKEYPAIVPGKNFSYPGPTPTPEKSLQAADVFVLPTYREGFGSSVIEAQCLGLPAICSDTYGVMDAVEDDVTGLRCHVADSDSLYRCMKAMMDDPERRGQMGRAGRERVLRHFAAERLTQAWADFYTQRLR